MLRLLSVATLIVFIFSIGWIGWMRGTDDNTSFPNSNSQADTYHQVDGNSKRLNTDLGVRKGNYNTAPVDPFSTEGKRQKAVADAVANTGLSNDELMELTENAIESFFVKETSNQFLANLQKELVDTFGVEEADFLTSVIAMAN